MGTDTLKHVYGVSLEDGLVHRYRVIERGPATQVVIECRDGCRAPPGPEPWEVILDTAELAREDGAWVEEVGLSFFLTAEAAMRFDAREVEAMELTGQAEPARLAEPEERT